MITSLVMCSRKSPDPDPAIVETYQKNADLFCTAIVECLKDDVKNRMKGNPDFRDQIIGRMDRDLCHKGQYSLIGKLSVFQNPQGNAETAKEVYNTYERCAKAVSEAPDCEDRLRIHRENPDCQSIRKKH